MNRIIIVANKAWEADAAIAAMFNLEFRKAMPGAPGIFNDIKVDQFHFPWNNEFGETSPRIIFTKEHMDIRIEFWCLNSVMTKNPDEKNDFYYYSRSGQKAMDFHRILEFSGDPVKLVIAFGTAGAPVEVSKNGGIVIGSNIFAFDAKTVESKLRYESEAFGTVVNSTISARFFDELNVAMSTLAMKSYLETAMLTPPSSPTPLFPFIADKNILGISDMNTRSYDDFKGCDAAAISAFKLLKKDQNLPQTAYSVETTHGIIRLESHCDKFIFISAITDRVAYFDNEVTPRVLAQNFSASFNGGLFLTWFIPFYFNTLDALV